MIRWHIKKIKAKWWKITFPWLDKITKIRVDRRLDVMVAINFLKGCRHEGGIPCVERMYVEGKGYTSLYERKNYLDCLENGV